MCNALAEAGGENRKVYTNFLVFPKGSFSKTFSACVKCSLCHAHTMQNVHYRNVFHFRHWANWSVKLPLMVLNGFHLMISDLVWTESFPKGGKIVRKKLMKALYFKHYPKQNGNMSESFINNMQTISKGRRATHTLHSCTARIQHALKRGSCPASHASRMSSIPGRQHARLWPAKSTQCQKARSPSGT